MYCHLCGKPISYGSSFCSSCGARCASPEPFSSTSSTSSTVTTTTTGIDYFDPDKARATKNALSLGILSIVFSVMNYMLVPFVHLLGIGFGINAIVKASKLLGESKKAVAALVTGIIGLSLGVIALIIGFWGGLMMSPS